MINLTNEIEEQEFFLSRKGDIPFWDHPLMRGYKLLPTNYYPLLNHSEVLGAKRRGLIDEVDLQLMKVIGDAIAINENQLRRAMTKAGYSYSETSKRLQKLRRNGFVDRWKCRLENDESETIKPPAPFTLGVAGYMLMRQLYDDQPFTSSEKWDKQGASSIQRYVSTNEFRITLAELRVLRNWKWHVGIAHKKYLGSVLGAATIETPNGMINLLVERAQMSQNFMGYLGTKLHKWNTHYDKHGTLDLNGMNNHIPVVVIYVSTFTMAKYIQENLMLDSFSYSVWILVEEDIDADVGIGNGFYQPTSEGLVKIELPFFQWSESTRNNLNKGDGRDL